MTEAQAAHTLIDTLPRALSAAGAKEKVSAVVTRLLLTVTNYPSLQAYLTDVGLTAGKSPGSVKLEMEFNRLPSEVMPELRRVLSAREFSGYEEFSYVKNEQARTGLRFHIDADDLPGKPIDYAY